MVLDEDDKEVVGRGGSGRRGKAMVGRGLIYFEMQTYSWVKT